MCSKINICYNIKQRFIPYGIQLTTTLGYIQEPEFYVTLELFWIQDTLDMHVLLKVIDLHEKGTYIFVIIQRKDNAAYCHVLYIVKHRSVHPY